MAQAATLPTASPFSHPSRGLTRVVPPAAYEQQRALQDREKAEAYAKAVNSQQTMTDLAGYVRGLYDMFRTHRDMVSGGWSARLIHALRTFNGEYHPSKLQQIRQFGGSEVYARLVAMKCRGASSLLRDVYLSPDRPWGLAPPADPDIPPEIMEHIKRLVMVEVEQVASMGASDQLTPDAIKSRIIGLTQEAKKAELKKATVRAKAAEDRIEELFQEGGFYSALAELIVDVPLFPYGVLKGPEVRVVPTVKWSDQGVPITEQTPRMMWERLSPFDVYWTPGARTIETADVIERGRLARSEINDCLDLPGYMHDEVRTVLDEYGRGGLADDWDSYDAERAVQENRENPRYNRSGMINFLKFSGNIQGKMLTDWGMPGIEDPVRDYKVMLWLIGTHVIKCQRQPNPRQRHNYFITSFEKVPGTPVGNGLPDILADIEDVANATLRALVNNLSIASGPQVVVTDDRLAPGEEGEELFPWKRWHVNSDPMGNNTQVPISFFQPNSNAQDLLAIYKEFNTMADDLSAIPKYITGQGASSGAGRTAAGLAMLMGNASKILQTVAANIDGDIVRPVLMYLYDMLMLTDNTGVFSGHEAVEVKGVNVAVQRETQRSRQLEFLSITANPIDAPIIGTKGRASLLRSVAGTIGLDGEQIVPSEEQIAQAEAEAQAQAQMDAAIAAGAPPPTDPNMVPPDQAGAQAEGAQPSPTATQDVGPRVSPTVAGGAG